MLEAMHTWQTTRFAIDLSRPRVMGIVNVTPDSFSDGGRHADTTAALQHAQRLVDEGADILDIGGESTRPGAPTVPADEEWARIEGVLRGAMGWGVPLSVDTCKPEVMQRALDLGADIINDVQALGAPGALDEVGHFLQARLQALTAAGIEPERITLDPGIGFGKTPAHNLALLRRQKELLRLGRPLLLGWSRKSTLGEVTGRPVEQRLAASLAAALAAVKQGAGVVRVHDVAQTVDALRVWEAAGLLD